MATLTAQQIYALARQAGFADGEGRIATAIALAESGGRTDAVGDTTITTGKWGPSVGLWQVRTLKAETGKGSVRDINWLLASPANQAKAAYQIRMGANGFKNWSVFSQNKGAAYKEKLPGVDSVVTAEDAKNGQSWWQKILSPGGTANLIPGDPVKTGVEGVGAAAAEVSGWSGGLQKLLESVTSADWWKRIGIGAAGVVLVLVAVIVMLWSQKSKIVGGIAGDVVKAVKK